MAARIYAAFCFVSTISSLLREHRKKRKKMLEGTFETKRERTRIYKGIHYLLWNFIVALFCGTVVALFLENFKMYQLKCFR